MRKCVHECAGMRVCVHELARVRGACLRAGRQARVCVHVYTNERGCGRAACRREFKSNKKKGLRRKNIPKACKRVWMVWACGVWVYVQMCGQACGQAWCMSGFECVCMCGRELLGQTKKKNTYYRQPSHQLACLANIMWACGRGRASRCASACEV